MLDAITTGAFPHTSRVGVMVVASCRRGGAGETGQRGTSVTCAARQSAPSTARVSLVGSHQRRDLASSSTTNRVALAFGAAGGGGGRRNFLSRGRRVRFLLTPRSAAARDDIDEGEEDWEKLFANLQPLAPDLPPYKVKSVAPGRVSFFRRFPNHHTCVCRPIPPLLLSIPRNVAGGHLFSRTRLYMV